MNNLERVLLSIIGQISLSDFNSACDKAEVSEAVKKIVLDKLAEEGV